MLKTTGNILETSFTKEELSCCSNSLKKNIFEKLNEMICFGKFPGRPKIKIKGQGSFMVMCIIKNMFVSVYDYIALFDEKNNHFIVFKSNNPEIPPGHILN
jgi:hypothetical protein